jgi:hypothetical protein
MAVRACCTVFSKSGCNSAELSPALIQTKHYSNQRSAPALWCCARALPWGQHVAISSFLLLVICGAEFLVQGGSPPGHSGREQRHRDAHSRTLGPGFCPAHHTLRQGSVRCGSISQASSSQVAVHLCAFAPRERCVDHPNGLTVTRASLAAPTFPTNLHLFGFVSASKEAERLRLICIRDLPENTVDHKQECPQHQLPTLNQSRSHFIKASASQPGVRICVISDLWRKLTVTAGAISMANRMATSRPRQLGSPTHGRQ